MGCGASASVDDADDADDADDEEDTEQQPVKAPPPTADPRRGVKASSVSAVASLDDATTRCRAVVEAVLSGLGDSLYTDPLWSPSSEEDADKILYVDGIGPSHESGLDAPERWERLSALCESPVLISDRIRAADVHQGGIGDCFLLSAVAAVASSRPALLRELFVRYDIAKGVYGVRLFLSGAWMYVLVDDYIALDDEGEKLYASCSDANALWLPVLEKAIAKACCCYENLDGGNVEWALEVVTGGLADPRDKLLVEELEPFECWQRVSAFLTRGDILAVSTYDDDDYAKRGFKFDGVKKGRVGEGVLECGLVGGHAYALLGVHEYQGHHLYKLRNPWGSGEWNLAWSDSSAEMDEAARAALGATVEDDGVFFMEKADFSAHWESVAPVRLWDASWSVASTCGYFHRGEKLGVATCAHRAEDADELTYKKGDALVLTDMQSNTWWKGYKQKAPLLGRKKDEDGLPKEYYILAEEVELAAETPQPLKFQLTAEAETEAILVLLQPDLHTRRAYTYSRKLRTTERVKTYSSIRLMVKSADEEEEVAEGDDTDRKVTLTVTLGPDKPLVASVVDYGGQGQKYELIVYSRSPATITPLSGSSADDEAKAAFASYDANGQGVLSRDEMAAVLQELEMLSSLSVEEQRRLIDAHFDKAAEEGLRLEGFLEWQQKLLQREGGGGGGAAPARAAADMEC